MDWDYIWEREDRWTALLIAFLTHQRPCDCAYCASNATVDERSAPESVEKPGRVSGLPSESGEFRDSTAPA